MNTCRKFLVDGRVQGVWFRESTRQQADRLGISGYAINLPDGRVEVLACGESPAIETLAGWLRRGPPLAKVQSILETDCDETCPNRFSTG